MQTHLMFTLSVFVFRQIWICYGNDRTNFVLKKFEHCDPNENYLGKFNFTFKTIGNQQYIDGTITLDAPFDNNLPSNFSMETLIGKQFMYLFSITERKACDATHRYMGEFVYELERHAQIIPGMCRIVKGRYHLHDVLLDYDRITLQTFPFGTLRFTNMVYTHGRKGVYFCFVAVVENRI